MAITVTLKDRIKMGNAFMAVADVTLDNSYPTGGEEITPKSLGLNVIHGLMPYPAGGYLFEFVHSTGKLKAYTPVKVQAAHTHVFTGAAMTTTPTTLGGEPAAKLLQNDGGVLKSTDVTPVALGTPAGINAAGGAISAAAAAEVANTTDLHAVTVRVIAIGI